MGEAYINYKELLDKNEIQTLYSTWFMMIIGIFFMNFNKVTQPLKNF